ncbi:MAG: polyprenol monophosphomannose synthase [Spirochaetales bacterium]|nr:polyprenol monophosphomannose synthase [Spirochaetales bacterium]
MKTASIILPTYNEKDNIIELISRILEHVEGGKEIIVIDDDSPDGTAANVQSTYRDETSVRLIVRKGEKGLTSAIQRGIAESRGDVIVWMDCDLSMPPEKINDLLHAVQADNCDAAVGSRYVKGGSDVRTDSGKALLFLHTALSYIITRFASLMLWPGFRDWTSGFIAVKSGVIKPIRLKGDYGEYFIDMMYRILKGGFKVREVPYSLVPRKRGQSKTATNILGFISRGVKYIGTIFRLKLGL